jgi:predicted O-linked N-acetylglucosamine transferase (SPINDLY family)
VNQIEQAGQDKASTNALLQKAVALHQEGKLSDANAIYESILQSEPGHFDALQLLGAIAVQTQNYERAIAILSQVLKLQPNYVPALNNYGIALHELKQFEQALVNYQQAIALAPNYAHAHFNLANTLYELKYFDRALASYQQAIAIWPNYSQAHCNRGNALQKLSRFDQALAAYELSISIEPACALNHFNRGKLLERLNRLEEALVSYQRALELDSEFEFLPGIIAHMKMQLCDWQDFDHHLQLVRQKNGRLEKATLPFGFLALIDAPSEHLQCAQTYANTKFPENHKLGLIPKRNKKSKIRIGYFSADFRTHALLTLICEMLELHNKNLFEIIAFSCGPKDNSSMRLRASQAFDQFIDIDNLSDTQAAQLARQLEIDIAVDLSGHTNFTRPGIFALRAAPIQVNYLGFAGTMGADYVDYIVADPVLIPQSAQVHFSEKVVYLPHTYQANDRKNTIADRLFTRSELGLPEHAFVFCSFNAPYKILPDTFASWMRILGKVPGSVLWLIQAAPSVKKHLRQEAAKHGIEANRLVFAPRMGMAEHLSRHRQADLFLDTFPYTAHTTASNALWVGLPVLTLMGQSFASRVGASLLNAIHLPELITHSMAQYESLAIELASNLDKLGAIRSKLAAHRSCTPLFDTPLFTQHLEQAYRQMYDRYQADLAPDHIYVHSLNSIANPLGDID